MAEEKGLSRQSFLHLAGLAGLKTGDPHLEQLYSYLEEILPKLKGVDEPPPAAAADQDLHTYIQRYLPKLKRLADLDLAGLDPALVFRPPAGGKHE